jgi:glycosyltransferase involved in cell wall biosynthesis
VNGTSLRLAVFATHPIQNHAPWFRALVGEGVDLHVFFSVLPDADQQSVGFGRPFSWDTPLLEGYPWTEIGQAWGEPRLGRFWGLRNRGVADALSEYAPDAVVLTGWHSWALFQAARASVLLGLPRVVRGDSNALRPRSRMNLSVHRTLFALYDAFVAMGRVNRALYEAAGVPPDRIVDGGHPVDTALLLAAARRELPRRNSWREMWGVPRNACCFLFAGKLQDKKRPLDFVRALAGAASALPREAIHGLVAGGGDLEREVRELAAAIGAPVTYSGFLNQTEIGRAYAASDALVLPSDWGETWGLVVNEAMLFGLPAIVSDRVGCGPDLVEEGKTGFVFPFGDVEALAARLSRLAIAPDARREMGMAARTVAQRHSPERAARATVQAADVAMGRS